MIPSDPMTARELRASLGLAGIFGLRMLGMFIILPVFALYASGLPGGENRALVGLALGAYGLTQAGLQIPFGWLSDLWGRKQTIYLGLAIFAAGSLVAGLAQDLIWVTVGRVIQGGGAISAAVVALAADLTRESQRTKAMAIIGMTIGLSFAVSMVAGPFLGHVVGVPGIFILTGLLALGAMLVTRFLVPDPVEGERVAAATSKVSFLALFSDPQLLRLNYGIFALHAILMALFVTVPFALQAHLPVAQHWKIYLSVMLAAFAIMVPPMMLAERRNWQKPVFGGAVMALSLAIGLLAISGDALVFLAGGLVVFFSAFNLLEAMLPSLISRLAPAAAKGTAIGIYSSIQFVGTFAGAAAGGWLAQESGAPSVAVLCAGLAGVWLLLVPGMRMPPGTATRHYRLPAMEPPATTDLMRALAGLPGVHDVNLSGDGMACLTVDRQGFDEQNVIKLLAGENQTWHQST